MDIIDLEDEEEYSLTEKQALCLVMLAPSDEAPKSADIRMEMVHIIHAWRRGRLLPRSSTPLLNEILREFPEN